MKRVVKRVDPNFVKDDIQKEDGKISESETKVPDNETKVDLDKVADETANDEG